MMKVSIDDIKIPYYYGTPKPDKYSEKLNTYLRGGVLSPIVVDEDLNLTDGYISYLIYKHSGLSVVDVVHEDEIPIIFIKGCHPHSVKEYIWYVPTSLRKKFQKKVHVGDTVRCRANNRCVPVVVQEIFTATSRDRKIAPVMSF